MKSLHTVNKLLLLTLSSSLCCLAALYSSFADLPTRTYDFVIVGGGGAGNVLANRLTENPKVSVLVLEAGGPVPKDGMLEYVVPFFSLFVTRGPSPHDWNYTSIAQEGLNGRVFEYPRGKLLGGCTSHNGMLYERGPSDDYDRYASVTHDSGWSWENVQPYFRKNERWTPPADHHNTTGQFDPSIHGFHGITSVSLSGFPRPINNRVIETTVEVSDDFPFNLDINSGNTLGLGWAQSTIKGGERSSSATSYLGPEFINRPNLHVLVHAQVTRILHTGTDSGKPAFQAVEFAESPDRPRRSVTASKEVILSAGTIGTPQILMNSGIGDQDEFGPLGIQTHVHLPDVGKNLSVHVEMMLSHFVNSTDTWDDILRNSTLRAQHFDHWNQTRTGPLVDSVNDHIMFVRLPENATIFKDHPDPAPGLHAGHFHMGTRNGNVNPPPSGHFMTVSMEVLTPTSRGSVKLNTSNPFDQPLIDFGALTTDFDIFAMREGFKIAQKFTTAPAWKGYILGPLDGPGDAPTDAELEQFIRENASPNGHIVGAAAMSPKGASYGVVDPDLRVKGTSRLRVVDASIFPFTPASTTQVPVYVVAERAADLIKAAWES